MPLKRDNPAGRLHFYLKQMLARKDQGGSAEKIFCEMFELPLYPQFRPRLLHSLGLLFQLPLEAEAAVKAIPDMEPAIYLTWVPRVAQAFKDIQLSNAFSSFLNGIDETTLSVLAICSDQLSKNPDLREEVVTDEKRLLEVLKEVQKLINETRVLEPPHLRDYMLHHLMIIERAILDYQLQGIKALRLGLEQSVGSFILQRTKFTEARESPLGKRFLAVIGAYVILCDAVSYTLHLPSEIRHLLPAGEQKVVEPKTETHATLPGN